MTVRILRVLEYRYPTVEDAASDMSHWTPQVNMRHVLMASTYILPETVSNEDANKELSILADAIGFHLNKDTVNRETRETNTNAQTNTSPHTQ